MKTKEEWVNIFAKAKHGHILWDGWAKDPYNPEHAYTSSHNFINHMSALGFFKPGDRVLDIGCGNGRLGIALSEKEIVYEGFDPMKKCIEFCKTAFKDYPNFNFQHLDIWNECSNPDGAVNPMTFEFPYADLSFDCVIAFSVFTHLQQIEIATHYMCEITRVLKPKGKFFSSWYRSPPNELDPFVGRTVFLESDIMTILNDFTFQFTYGGHTPQYYDQWALAATKV